MALSDEKVADISPPPQASLFSNVSAKMDIRQRVEDGVDSFGESRHDDVISGAEPRFRVENVLHFRSGFGVKRVVHSRGRG